MAGISRGLIETYLQEFMWRKMKTANRVDCFNKLLSVVRDQYPVVEIEPEDRNDFTQ